MDNINSMMYVGEKPWHELGKKLDKAPNAEEAIIAAGLNWEVETKPVYHLKDDKSFSIVDGRQLIVRKDTQEVLGDVGSRFVPLQNKQAFDGLDQGLREIGATYETAGCLGNGSRVWILAKLPNDLVIQAAAGDTVKKYILLAHAHDGSLAVKEFLTPIRVVCQNTLNASLSLSENDLTAFSARHTRGIGGKVKTGLNQILEANKIFDTLGQLYGRMLARKMTVKEVDAYFRKVVNIGEDIPGEKPSRVIEELSIAFDNPKNTIGEMRGSLWAAYNALTETVDHGGRAGQLDTRANSLLFGNGARTKIKALDQAKALLVA